MQPRAPRPPPPWEALHLVAPFLDAKSLAMASCVSAAWRAAFSADHLWARLCLAHYPSYLHLPAPAAHSPPRRLFALFRSASRRRRAPPAPRLALADVVFAVDFFAGADCALSLAVPGDEAKNAGGDVFRFEVDVRASNVAVAMAVAAAAGAWRVGWTVVTKDSSPAAAIAMVEAKGPMTGGKGDGREAWVVESLPAPCGGGRLEAEVVVEMAGAEEDGGWRRRRVENVRLGVMCECRYIGLDEGLRYLQHFLLA